MSAKQQIGQTKLEYDIFRLCNTDKGFAAKMVQSLDKSFLATAKLQNYLDFYKPIYLKHKSPPTKEILEAELMQLSLTEQEPIKKAMDIIFSPAPDPEPINKVWLTDKIITMAKKRQISTAISESDDIMNDGEYTDDKYYEILSKLKDAIKYQLDTNIGVSIYDIEKRYDRIRDSLGDKIKTGFSLLDATALDGGLAKGELSAFLGPPGVGKTIFLVNLGANLLKAGYNVIHYSMEMSEERLGVRYDAIFSGIEQRILNKASLESVEAVKKHYRAIRIGSKGSLYLKGFPTASATSIDLESHIEDLKTIEKADYVPDVIIVDYGDIMKSSRRGKDAYEEQGWIFRELRALAQQMNVAVVTATQATRGALEEGGGTKADIGMDKVADSMEKNRILDILFSIVQTKSEKENGYISLYMAKNRNGESGKSFDFRINYSTMKLDDANSIASSGSKNSP